MKNEQEIIWKAKDDQHILKGVQCSSSPGHCGLMCTKFKVRSGRDSRFMKNDFCSSSSMQQCDQMSTLNFQFWPSFGNLVTLLVVGR